MINLRKRNRSYRGGYTLVELITVLVILALMAALVVPSLAGFIEKTKERQYVLEAQGVQRSIELYLIAKNDPDLDPIMLHLELTSARLDSPRHPLAGYLTVRCTKGAYIEGLTINTSAFQVVGIKYRVAKYMIEIDGSKITVERTGKK